MTSGERAAPPSDWAEPPAPVRFVLDTWTITRTELGKVRHDPVEILSRAIQPLLWLVIFGQVVAGIRGIPTGSLSYLDFLAPGVLAQSALFSAIFYGLAVIWERDMGVIHKLMVSPASRHALVLGKSVAGGVRAIVPTVVVYAASIALGVDVNLDPLAILGVVAVVILGSGVFAAFSLVIACIVRSRERLMGIGQLLTMPLFFASSAIYPVVLMPDWLQTIALLNPLTYMVDALRSLMIVGAPAGRGLPVDVTVLGACLVGFVALGGSLYPRLSR